MLAVVLLPNLHRRGYAARQSGLRLRAYAGLFRYGAVNWMLFVRAATSMSFGIFMLLAGPKLVDTGGGLEAVGLFVGFGAIGGGGRAGVGWETLRRHRPQGPARRDRWYWEPSRRSCSESRTAWSCSCSRPASSGSRRAHFKRCLSPSAATSRRAARWDASMALQTSSFSWGLVVGMLVAGFLEPVSAALPFHVTAAVLIAAIVGSFKLPEQITNPSRLDAKDQPDPVAAS